MSLLFLLAVTGCVKHLPDAPSPRPMPAALAGHAVVLAPGDPDYDRAHVTEAVMLPGAGGVREALVVRITDDVPVWRLWSGPDKRYGGGRTNRIGQWWTPDAPGGTRAQYRVDYEVCAAWNDLTWVVQCTLKAGAVVAAGPGQSVSAETCGVAGEAYPTSDHLQLFVWQPWRQPEALVCPEDAADHAVDPGCLGAADACSAGGARASEEPAR
jgi:hypothetical protein